MKFIFYLLLVLCPFCLYSQTNNNLYPDSVMKAEILKELLSIEDGSLSFSTPSTDNDQDIEYKYFVKKKSLNGGYCLELKTVTFVDSIAKTKYGPLIEDRDVFSGYSYSQKIEILEELLSFQGDTVKSGKSYKINSPDLSRVYIKPFNIQIEALYTFSKMLLIGYPPILPKLTDDEGLINYNNCQCAIDEVYEIYRQWLHNAIKDDFRNLSLPMSGTKYQWKEQKKITNNWFINFHYERQ